MKKICDLEIIDTQKKILTLLVKPRSVYELAAKTKKSYSSVSQNLGILCALGLLRKVKKRSGGVMYFLKDCEA
jgi:predicted transcriptional regulator